MECKVSVLLNNCKQNTMSLSLLVGTTVDKHNITILYHLHQCRFAHHEIGHAKVGKCGIKCYNNDIYHKKELFYCDVILYMVRI